MKKIYINTCHKISPYFSYVITIVVSILLQIEWSISVFIFFTHQIRREQGDLSPTIYDRGS